MAKHNIKGLKKFVRDVMNCSSKEEEAERVSQELTHLRDQLRAGDRAKRYDLKKAAAKLMFISMLGHQIDFGLSDVLRLLRGRLFTEKQIGYLALGMLCTEDVEEFQDGIPMLLQDIELGSPIVRSCAFSLLGQILGERLVPKVYKPMLAYLTRAKSSTVCIPDALLVLMRCVRVAPDQIDPSELLRQVVKYSSVPSIPVRNAAFLLLDSLLIVHGDARAALTEAQEAAEENGEELPSDHKTQLADLSKLEPTYMSMVCTAASQLLGLLSDRKSNAELHYFHLTFPWHMIVLLRVMQHAPYAELDSLTETKLDQVLERVATLFDHALQTAKPGTGNHRNLRAALYAEALAVATRFNKVAALGNVPKLVQRLLSARHTNTRLLALKLLELLAYDEAMLAQLREHMTSVLRCLDEPDISIRKRAVDALFAMATEDTVRQVVQNLLKVLGRAEVRLREEIVLRVAELADRYSDDTRWYASVVLCLLRDAPDEVPDDVWFRATLTLRDASQSDQRYVTMRTLTMLLDAAERVGQAAQDSFVTINGPMLRFGASCLGLYGKLLYQLPSDKAAGEDEPLSLSNYLTLFMDHYQLSQPLTRVAILMLAAKLAVANAALRRRVIEFFERHKRSVDPEVQQRVAEYLLLLHQPRDVARRILLSTADTPAGAGSPGGFSGPGGTGGPGGSDGLDGQLAQLELARSGDDTNTPVSDDDVDLLGDLLGGGGGGGGGGGPAEATNQAFFAALLAKSNEGVLFEDSTLRVEYRSRISGKCILQALLQLQNKQAAALQGVTATVEYGGGDQGPVEVQLRPAPETIRPGQQAQLALQARAARAAQKHPLVVRLCYSVHGSAHTVVLTLPIVTPKWFQGLAFSREAFLGRWRAIPATQEEQAVYEVSAPLQNKQAMLQFLCAPEGLRFQSVSEITNAAPQRIACAATIAYATGGVGGVLLGMESSSDTWQRVRITVRATTSELSQAVLGTFALLFQ